MRLHGRHGEGNHLLRGEYYSRALELLEVACTAICMCQVHPERQRRVRLHGWHGVEDHVLRGEYKNYTDSEMKGGKRMRYLREENQYSTFDKYAGIFTAGGSV